MDETGVAVMVAEPLSSGTGGSAPHLVQPLVDGPGSFAEMIRELSGTDVGACFQCGKCASGCPVSYAMDRTPAQLVHAIQLGLRDQVLRSTAIWLCSSCQTCTTRCPQGVDVAAVMDAARIIAQRERVAPSVPGVARFLQVSISSIRHFGRTYELGLIAGLKLSTGNLTEDLGLGLRMLRKRKLSLLPGFGGSREARRIIRRTGAIEGRR